MSTTAQLGEKHDSPVVMTQAQLCKYLDEIPNNIGAKAGRHGMSVDAFLAGLALEKKQEVWRSEQLSKTRKRWIRAEK